MLSQREYEIIANILRVDKEVIEDVEKKMSLVTGKNGIIEKIVEENNVLIKRLLSQFGICNWPFYEDFFEAIINYLHFTDKNLYEFLGRPDFETGKGCDILIKEVSDLAEVSYGFFIKKEVAENFLRKTPPQNIIKFLGYRGVEDLLKNENIFEIFSALRFIETSEWMNNEFIKSYKNLKPEDFEERKINLIVLKDKWLKAAEKFMKKKYHNVSHLKELGVIFIIPVPINSSGETLRLFSLLVHYLNEVPFYSKLFKYYSQFDNFAERVISLLRGDVLEGPLPPLKEGKIISWRIVQRYLAKDNINDPRLFEPHVNPEAIHWLKAELSLAKLSRRKPELGLGFWHDLNWVGGFFNKKDGSKELLSVNLIDNTMSLVKRENKYLYHHQEALWNKIFKEYMGEETMEKLIEENIFEGYIEL